MHSITGVFFMKKILKKLLTNEKQCAIIKVNLKKRSAKNGRFKTRTRRTV